jgi:uncharacterized repeat protein (TIGR01451 family)
VIGVLLVAAVSGCGEEHAAASPSGPADLRLAAQVRDDPADNWERGVTAAAGDTVSFRIQLFNAGGEQARDVRLRVSMPRGLRFAGGSGTWEKLGLGIANGDPLPEGLFGRGLDVGELPSLDSSWVEFDARVRDSAAGERLVAQVTAESAADGDGASASVTVLRGG